VLQQRMQQVRGHKNAVRAISRVWGSAPWWYTSASFPCHFCVRNSPSLWGVPHMRAGASRLAISGPSNKLCKAGRAKPAGTK